MKCTDKDTIRAQAQTIKDLQKAIEDLPGLEEMAELKKMMAELPTPEYVKELKKRVAYLEVLCKLKGGKR